MQSTQLERLVNGAEKPFIKPEDMPRVEVPTLFDSFQGMLTVEALRRKPAAELLRHEWLAL
ncbi:hypothetical protein NUU61_001949 [Penicillium alfredii]|uniref:Uncharacterized protein n=1 Tax=Penicillium alfredii TaxID=1506179 RepID=A0A9W9FR94_9EURO|nr:uncharacterized protein NUU61_001949 [Penicillium alfredii]KAJ5104602.1 hypothetical protein NUU61_001949 [Penicillium alfredii]